MVVNTPVDSTIYSAPAFDHGISAGFLLSNQFTHTHQVPVEDMNLVSIHNQRVAVLANSSLEASMSGIVLDQVDLGEELTEALSLYGTMYSASINGSLIATTLQPAFSKLARSTRRPIRPNLAISMGEGMLIMRTR